MHASLKQKLSLAGCISILNENCTKTLVACKKKAKWEKAIVM
jgi:hypothetical protein